MNTDNKTSSRIVSLDVFRGVTIAGMIIVNDPGSWDHVYPPLRHASWHGLTPTDLVFPFFLFIVGVTTVLSLSRRKAEGKNLAGQFAKIARRATVVFGLGILLWLFPNFDFQGIRWPGVLQRIAIVYAATAIIYLASNWRFQLGVCCLLLIGYCALMQLAAVPMDQVIQQAISTGEVPTSDSTTAVQGLQRISENSVEANLQPGTNLAAWVDRNTTPDRLWETSWDPEGLLSTLPAIASGLIGLLIGQIFLRTIGSEQRALYLMMIGFAIFVAGYAWSWQFPFNKNLWTSSFVLATSGLAAMTWGLVYWIVDIKRYTAWTGPFLIFGSNAIAAYVLHGLLGKLIHIPVADTTIPQQIMQRLMAIGLPSEAASLGYALLFTMTILFFVWLLHRKQIFLRV